MYNVNVYILEVDCETCVIRSGLLYLLVLKQSDGTPYTWIFLQLVNLLTEVRDTLSDLPVSGGNLGLSMGCTFVPPARVWLALA